MGRGVGELEVTGVLCSSSSQYDTKEEEIYKVNRFLSRLLLGTRPEASFMRQAMLDEHNTQAKVVVMPQRIKSYGISSDTFHQ